MQAYFNALADYLQQQLQDQECFTCGLVGEDSDFVRFNRGLIRQSGHVNQMELSIDWINGQRHAISSVSLSGDWTADVDQLAQILAVLRQQIADVPEDPYFMMATEVHSTEHVQASRLPATLVMLDQILAVAKDYDFVGLLACGAQYRGFANAYGQRNWHEIASFNLDWSLYHNTDKAVKTAYAGFEWDQAAFRAKIELAVQQLALLQKAPVSVPPGAYRAYLAPAAIHEIMSMFNWDGVSEKSLRTKQSALLRMRDEGLCLNPMFSLSENTRQGLAPGFQEDGFIKPPCLKIIEQGRLVDALISPRTAQEYALPGNGADGSESMQAIDMAAGELPLAQVLAQLGTGVYISNLWYLNFSDRANFRITGMTRFASFWVENGVIQAPLNVMRFDDSIFKLFGDHLLALTAEREMIIDSDTYGQRGVNSARLPGALVKDLMFVL
jgi:predicted Zn-dependent protease